MRADLLRRVAGNAVAGDPYYSAVSLLLHFNGANGSTTFTDSSSNNLTVTPTNATINTAQSKFGGASGSFNGTNSYLSVAANSVMDFGSSDFTAECWFYINSGTAGGIFYISGNATSFAALRVGFSSSKLYILMSKDGAAWSVTSGLIGSTLSMGTWYHLAVTRSGTSVQVFLNGTQIGTTYTLSGSLTVQSYYYIGSTTVELLNGYVDDVRLTKGVARYTSNFTVPSAPFPDKIGSIEADAYYPQTSLLLHMDGTNASTSFVDSGPNALAVTASGDAKISTTQSKFGGASGAFDGNGDYVSLPNSSLFTFTGDFTVEGWVYINSLPTSGNYAGLFFSRGNGATDSAFQFYMYNNAGTYRLDQTLSVGSTDYGLTFNFSTAPSANTWNHFAFVRNGSNVYSFWNGVQVGATQTVSGALNATTYAPTVGGRAGPWPGLWLNGYIDEFRVTKAARYTSNFTPRAKAFPDIYNPYKTLPVSGAALWLDGADSSTLFTDAGVTPVKVNGDLVYQWNDKSGNSRHATQTTSGNRPTWVPPASGRNGLGALAFNGSSQNLEIASSSAFTFGSGDFTIEGWFYFGSFGGANYAPIFANSYLFYVGSSGEVLVFNGSTNVLTGTAGDLSLNTWSHIAFVRSGTSMKAYVNGAQKASATVSATISTASTNYIGRHSSVYLNGKIQNFVVYNGQALYTANFTPWMS